MELRLANKCILVTGGSRGIGAAIAARAAELGARVALTYSSQQEAAEQVKSRLRGEGHLVLQMNVGDEKSVEAAMSQTLAAFGRLDGLVNNAGVTADQLLLRMKTDDFDKVLQTNLRGTFFCTRLAVKPMMKQRSGSIVSVTSVIGQTGNAGQANYAASKAGIEAFIRSVAQEFGSRNVRANCVAPGFIATEMTEILTDAQKQAIMEKIPLGKIGEGLDIANAVCFLLSEESKYITGHTLSVNGGMNMR